MKLSLFTDQISKEIESTHTQRENAPRTKWVCKVVGLKVTINNQLYFYNQAK